jgi:hypothetical protein
MSAVGPIYGFILANGKHSFISLLPSSLVDIRCHPAHFCLLCFLPCAAPLSLLCIPRSLAFTFAIPIDLVAFRRLHSFHLCIPLQCVNLEVPVATLYSSSTSLHSWTLNRNTHVEP